MSYSEEQTRRRLPLFYLALPAAAALVVLAPRYELLTDTRLLWLAPLWVALSHPLVGLSYAWTSRSLRKGWMLCWGSLAVYGQRGSLWHLQAALLVALFEETLLRYAALFELSEWLGRPWVALLLTSVVFAALHHRRDAGRSGWLQQLDLFGFGLLLGGVTLVTESLYPALLLHGMRNYILRCMLISRAEYEQLTAQR